MCANVCVCLCSSLQIFKGTTRAGVYLCLHACATLLVCMYVSLGVCVSVYMYMLVVVFSEKLESDHCHIYIHIHTHARTYNHKHVHAHPHTCTSTRLTIHSTSRPAQTRTIVGCDHKNDNVGDIRTPLTHVREGSVAGGVDECDRGAVLVVVRGDKSRRGGGYDVSVSTMASTTRVAIATVTKAHGGLKRG